MQFRAVLAGSEAMSKRWLQVIADTPVLAERIVIAGIDDLNRNAALADTRVPADGSRSQNKPKA